MRAAAVDASVHGLLGHVGSSMETVIITAAPGSPGGWRDRTPPAWAALTRVPESRVPGTPTHHPTIKWVHPRREGVMATGHQLPRGGLRHCSATCTATAQPLSLTGQELSLR